MSESPTPVRNETSKHASPTLFYPLLLIVLALCLMTGFQFLQLSKEKEILTTRLAAQAEPLQESSKVREQFQSIATGTAKLAESGNITAQRVMELLQRSGISVNLDDAARQ